ncbi:MAG: cupredoxin domain-containing protein [Caulobacteraceae bacterium]
MRRRAALAILAGAALLAAAAPKHAVHVVTISGLSYTPAVLTARVGDEVRWVNHDIFLHSATATDKSFDVTLKPHGSGQVVLRHPGVVTYICRYHPGMKGQIVVRK